MGRSGCLPIVLLLVASGVASSATATLILQDPAGDIDLRPVGPSPHGLAWTPADLLALEVVERPTEIDFIVSHRPQPDPDLRTLTDSVTWGVRFNVGAVAYLVEVYDTPLYGTDSGVVAYLFRGDSPEDSLGSADTRVAQLPAEFDVGAGRVTVTVLRADLRDELDIEAGGSQDLLNVHVEGWAGPLAFFGIEDGVSAHDRMPDVGRGMVDLTYGHVQQGHIRLATADRLRASNGVATTYFFDVNVTNLEQYDDTLALALGEVPAGWQARLPYDTLEVPANSTVRFPFLLTVPFNHEHGAIRTFTLEARGDKDPAAAGIIDIGVEFLEVAQPAGHHPIVFLHGTGAAAAPLQGGGSIQWGAARTAGWFNTLETDPRDPGEPLLATWSREHNLLDQRHGWVIPLDPTLRLGLDMDMEGAGLLEAVVGVRLPLDAAVLHGFIGLVDRGNITGAAIQYDDLSGVLVVADVGPVAVGDLAADQTRSVEAPVTPTPQGDLVPPGRDRNMVLVLWLEGNGPPPVLGYEDRAWIEPGGGLLLPLFEYHDPIDEAFAAPDFIHIGVEGSTQRFVAPGGTVLYDLFLRNDGIRDGTFDVHVYGTNADWVSFPAGTRFVAPSDGSVVIPVALAPTPMARPGDEADVVIEAVAREDERMRGLIRVKAIVDERRAVEQDADDTVEVQEIVQANKKSPAGVAALLLALALAARRLRMRAA